MEYVTFIKVGGSLLTDKNRPLTLNRLTVEVTARQLAEDYKRQPRPLVVGTGAGSFGHYHASRLPHSLEGVYDDLSASIIHGSVQKLSSRFVDELIENGVPAISLPAVSFLGHEDLIDEFLNQKIIVCVYGDMILDEIGWHVASTESLFLQLAKALKKSWQLKTCLLASNVPGVLDKSDEVIPVVTTSVQNHERANYDVTGGMASKVQYALKLAGLFEEVRIVDGREGGDLDRALRGDAVGSLIKQP